MNEVLCSILKPRNSKTKLFRKKFIGMLFFFFYFSLDFFDQNIFNKSK